MSSASAADIIDVQVPGNVTWQKWGHALLYCEVVASWKTEIRRFSGSGSTAAIKSGQLDPTPQQSLD